MTDAIVDCSDRHVVIGAGFVGLGMMAALQRAGIPFEAFEADDEIGGNWYHGVYETVHIISSRKTTQYGDWLLIACVHSRVAESTSLRWARSGISQAVVSCGARLA